MNNDSLTIGCIYRSSTGELGTSTESLCSLLGVVTESGSHLLICGDFSHANINWINNIGLANNSCAQQVINKLNDLFLFQHVNEPTRYRQNQTPDLVITNEEQMINEILYQPGLGLSDHVFEYLCYVERSNRSVPKFNLYCADFIKLNSLISSVD